jgi:glyoxylase-like metal-dependent hydrolase (beta-lactamase superfamily II)
MSAILILLLLTVSAQAIRAQTAAEAPYLEDVVERVSDHVFVIPGKGRPLVPNVCFIIGERGTLVVDTGMGLKNGALVVREAQKLSKGHTLYLTTTHVHPEHVTGEPAFPSITTWIVDEAQGDDIQRLLPELIPSFSARSNAIKQMLGDVRMGVPDIVFDREARLDLGGVTVRMLYFGPAHTHGDEVIFVEPDSILLPGDIVQNKMFPLIPDATGNARNWSAILDKLASLHPQKIVPDHGVFGDASLIEQEKTFFLALEARVAELKKEGKSAPDTVQMVYAEFQLKYSDWTGDRALRTVVQHMYDELP